MAEGKGNYGVNIASKSRKRGKKEREASSRDSGRRGEEKGKRVLLVYQSVPGRLAENSGHVRPCEAF